MAYFDSLTSLWNRRKILEFLSEELARSQRDGYPTSLILLDVDHFKKINDNYGHPVGDKVLVEIARRIRKAVRIYDRVGRFGGDELLVIVNNCGKEEARMVAERIRAGIGTQAFRVARRALAVTVSLGVVSTDMHPELSTSQLIQFSDQALYRAKRLGRNATVVHPGTVD
jgi:diguanylate cyclase (GGDEF)-like protein